MHICPFCAYINGLSQSRPKAENYNLLDNTNLPHEFIHLETSGAHIFDDKVIPRNDSCFFNKTEMLLIDQKTKDNMIFLPNKILCDVCLMNLYLDNKLVVVGELSEQEKLFRLYLRGLKI